jgi:hypothetical protein
MHLSGSFPYLPSEHRIPKSQTASTSTSFFHQETAWAEERECIPVERTPGTRRRCGMSVGMDCTSHALQAAAADGGGPHSAAPTRRMGKRRAPEWGREGMALPF